MCLIGTPTKAKTVYHLNIHTQGHAMCLATSDEVILRCFLETQHQIYPPRYRGVPSDGAFHPGGHASKGGGVISRFSWIVGQGFRGEPRDRLRTPPGDTGAGSGGDSPRRPVPEMNDVLHSRPNLGISPEDVAWRRLREQRD